MLWHFVFPGISFAQLNHPLPVNLFTLDKMSLKAATFTYRASDKRLILNSKIPISSPNPMLYHMLESSFETILTSGKTYDLVDENNIELSMLVKVTWSTDLEILGNRYKIYPRC